MQTVIIDGIEVKLCKNGHPRTPENVSKMGMCKICRKEYYEKWTKDNPGRAREGDRRWRKNNPEKTREMQRRTNSRRVINITKAYAASILELPVHLVSDELYQFKKEQMLIHRTLREFNRTFREIMSEENNEK